MKFAMLQGCNALEDVVEPGGAARGAFKVHILGNGLSERRACPFLSPLLIALNDSGDITSDSGHISAPKVCP